MHINLAEALRAVDAAIQALGVGADNMALSNLERARTKLAEVVDDPGGYACVALRELEIAAQGNPELRGLLVEAMSVLPLVVRARTAEGGELVEALVDVGGEWYGLTLGETRAEFAIVLRYPDAMQVASLGGDVSDLA